MKIAMIAVALFVVSMIVVNGQAPDPAAAAAGRGGGRGGGRGAVRIIRHRRVR
jgi:hypothetical protein